MNRTNWGTHNWDRYYKLTCYRLPIEGTNSAREILYVLDQIRPLHRPHSISLQLLLHNRRWRQELGVDWRTPEGVGGENNNMQTGRSIERRRPHIHRACFRDLSIITLKMNIFFISYSDVYLLIVSVEGYCGTWSHSMTHKNTQSVGILCTSDRFDAVTSTWQHTALTRQRDIHAPIGIQAHNPSKRTAAEPCLRSRGHQNRRKRMCLTY